MGSPSSMSLRARMVRARSLRARHTSRGLASTDASTRRDSVAVRAARWRARIRSGVCAISLSQALSSGIARWAALVMILPMARSGVHTVRATMSSGSCHHGTAAIQLNNWAYRRAWKDASSGWSVPWSCRLACSCRTRAFGSTTTRYPARRALRPNSSPSPKGPR